MKKQLVWIGLLTLFVFPVIGWGILQFFDAKALATMFRGSMHPLLQLPVGFTSGLLFGVVAKYVISAPFMKPIQRKYAFLIQNLRLNTLSIILLSFCAGFGEELLFRGALQPLIGVWITAIIFVAIHGYLNPLNWRLSIYGVVMTLIIVVLGYMTEVWGIFTACSSHMAIDIVLFKHLVDSGKRAIYISESE